MTTQPSEARIDSDARTTADQKSPAAAGSFVINLRSSTTPLALALPNVAALRRFSFFVSRRRESGSERFRLHMGYFATLAEAEEWLGVVRELYPGAWAGEAPGRKLRAQLLSPVTAAPAPIGNAAPTAASRAAPAPVGAPPSSTTAPPAGPVAADASAPSPVARPPIRSAQAVAKLEASLNSQSNLRQVLAELDADPADSSATAKVPRLTASAAGAAGAQTPAEKTLSDSQVLRVLEQRRDSEQYPAVQSDTGDIRLLKPDDAATMRELRQKLSANAPVSFAVQLEWSVQQIDLGNVPPLAIFNAYTLYTVEGNREGRRWYGLRLGFFSDAIAAKQVALYMRSEFGSIAVIPVGAKEKDSATTNGRLPMSTLGHKRHQASAPEEFQLIEEGVAVARPFGAGGSGEMSYEVTFVTDGEAPQPTGERPAAAARKPAARHRPPDTLEETLEILGANELSLDDGRLASAAGTTHRIAAGKKGDSGGTGTFVRLLDRLSERLKRGK
ncbi:MAG: hypothetical protein WCE48_10445 [Steroidobacteraceae bacterium]